MATLNVGPTLSSQITSVDIEEKQAESDGIPSSPAEMWNPVHSLSDSSSVVGYRNSAPTLVCDQEVVEILVNPESKCSLACSCACHYKYSARTPKLLDRAIGSIFVGYQGNPQGSFACDSKECIRQSLKHSLSSVTYMFPSWWMWRWAISFKVAPEYQLRVLRVRAKTDPIFKALSALKLRTVRNMLQDGEASVLDTNEDGQSLLTVSHTPCYSSQLLIHDSGQYSASEFAVTKQR
jgi:hypothetical protein